MRYAKTIVTFCALSLALALPAAVSGQRRASRARKAKARSASVKKVNRLEQGMWGGRSARLDVEAGGARVEFDCAHGTLEGPFTLDAERRFDVRGTFTRERGGPTLVPEGTADGQVPPDAGAETVPARYTGRVTGKTLTLTVTALDSGQTLGTFTLAHGRPPVLTKCL
ncbi:MAG TPA: hypothetical protein VGV38_04435 [Pyrinomonadaceae bacterium]|nr:hypothetical protein [Pyrinomonadaceae bacterium]